MENIVWFDGLPYRPALSEAMLDVLALIQTTPGIHLSELSRQRGVTNTATSRSVLSLEKLGLISTKRDTANAPRRCYPKGRK